MPYPPLDGGAQLIHNTTLGLLEFDVIVKVLAMNQSHRPVETETIPETYRQSTSFEFVDIDTRLKYWAALINLFTSESYFVFRFRSNKFSNRLKVLLSENNFDVIQLEHVYLCQYISLIRKYSSAKIILRSQNIEYIIWNRFKKGIRNPFTKWIFNIAIRRLNDYEKNVISHLDGLLPVTKNDADILLEYSPDTPCRVVPMGFAFNTASNICTDHKPLNIVYHLASMDWRPNEEAIRWFLTKVVPELKVTKGYTIIIAGSKMPKWVYAFQNDFIKIVGAVNDPLAFQIDKKVMIVPLLSGSGIRAKIIEGLALGKAIITTTVGAQGIDCEHEKNILIADKPEQFAQMIERCISDNEFTEMLGRNAMDLAIRLYHYKKSAKEMLLFYIELLS